MSSSAGVWRFYPRRLRVLAVVMSVALCGAVFFGWFALPTSLRATFTLSQRLTLLGLLAVLELVVVAIAASYVRADGAGVRFRNGLRSHSAACEQGSASTTTSSRPASTGWS
jgi:hypothetical protein